jgi:glucosamine-6-phosphate deaminase
MKRPRVIMEDDYAGLSQRAAHIIDAAVRRHPALVLALPTGATPVQTYAELVRLHRQTATDWSEVTTFNLDEYVGMASGDPQSYAAYMERHFFGHVNLARERTHLPDGLAPDPDAEAARYEAAIEAAGGIDLAVLGVGTNGHLGFNEPGDQLAGPTHVATLTDETWRHNFPDLALARDAGSRPYGRAYTMGIGTILHARRVLLLASGSSKRAILDEALRGPVTTRNPASFLQLHRRTTLILDSEAYGGIGSA